MTEKRYVSAGHREIPAEYELRSDGTAMLCRWPRRDRSEAAVVPEQVQGYPVTAVAPLAFAPYHLPAGRMAQLAQEPVISFSAFCMKHGREMEYETEDAGGPEEIMLPDSITEIGEYAFWCCGRLARIRIPGRVERLPAGVFGKCKNLREVILEEGIRTIGLRPEGTREAMPETGAFYNCSSMERLILPESVTYLGAETFNSSGIRILSVCDGEVEHAARQQQERWSVESAMSSERRVEHAARQQERSPVESAMSSGVSGISVWHHNVEVHPTAFHHTASLQWMEQCAADGTVRWRIGLPMEKETILRCDQRFGGLARLPELFFSEGPAEADRLAEKAFRLDFSGRMAAARLMYPHGLKEETERWYLEVLVTYADRAAYFMDADGETPLRKLAGLVCGSRFLTREQMIRLIHAAGEEQDYELAQQILWMQNKRFPEDTGFEELEL
jgi:hypothetical protein